MGTVFFKTTGQQENEIKSLMKNEGYTSKSEFFRFLLKFYKYQKKETVEEEIIREANELGALLTKLNKAGKLKDNLNEILDDL